MPSPGEDIQSWSTVAADNGTADPLIVWSEGQARASVNNSSRSEMAAHAKNRNLLNGSIVTTGSPNAQQFLSGLTYTTIPTGLVVKLKIGSGLTNTSSTTLNMDGLGATLIKTANGDVLLGGEFVADGYVDLLYNGTNWIFLYGREFMFDRITSGGGIIVGHQIFSTAGTFTYTPTAGMECCIVECIGGGGAGGAAYSGTGELYVAGGGGSGGYSRKYLNAADIGASQTVTVGYGGTPPGTAGGDTAFGALCLARGGGGGHNSQLGADLGTGGEGGTTAGAVGDIISAGAPGMPGTYNGSPGGVYGATGGSSALGGGGAATAGLTGINALNYGSGGGGGTSAGATASTGGYGSPGVIIVTEFAGRGAPGQTGATGPQGPVGPSGPGTGDVLVFGTPTAGQNAVWTDTSHIKGVTPTPPQITVYTSGSGTYTTPAGAVWLQVELVGGGAGGQTGTSGSGGNLGTSGTPSTFNGSVITASAGGANGFGGIPAGGDINIKGGDGNQGGNTADGVTWCIGGSGGVSFFGGAGGGFYNVAGTDAAPNSGSGGGGGGTNTSAGLGGRGGGAGGYCRKLIASPAASYTYTVGTGGAGGAVNGNNFAGGAGGSGIVIVTAHFGA